ncbi:MAG: outer membrane beta-barrel protein [bacterium]
MKKLGGIFVVGCLLCLAAASANAQDMGKFSVFAGYSWTTNTIDNGICEGYYCGNSTGLNGYTGSVVYNFNDHVGLEGNFSGHNGSPLAGSCTSPSDSCPFGDTLLTTKLHQDLYTYTFGPKFTVPVGNFSLFAHVLVGGAHVHEGVADGECFISGGGDPCDVFNSAHLAGNGFAFKTGGGVDWNHGRWGIRLLEVDYVHIAASVNDQTDGSTEVFKYSVPANNIELAAGITFNIGRR